MKPILYVMSLPNQGQAFWGQPEFKERVVVVDQYGLADIEWHNYSGVIVSMHSDQRWLQTLSDRIADFMKQGGCFVFQGHIAYPFLPELQRFTQMPSPTLEDFAVQLREPHPVFAGFEATSFNCRKGVAGFWGRGANPAPPGSRILNTMGQGAYPVDWEWSYGDGKLFMHGGNDLWTNRESMAENTQLFRQLLDWIQEVEQ